MQYIKAFVLGIYEFRRSFTTSMPEELEEAYGLGRELAHKVTLRHYED